MQVLLFLPKHTFAKKTAPFMRGRAIYAVIIPNDISSYILGTKGEHVMARSKRLESGFQDQLRKDLKEMFPGCMIFKMDQTQGIPDLLILHRDKWASLECKKSKNSKRQPNQEYYVDLMNDMSFSRFVYPENKESVLNELRETLQA